LYGISDFLCFCDETAELEETVDEEDVFADVWVEDEIFDSTFTDSLTSILIGFDHPDSNLIKNIRNYRAGETYEYFVNYSYGDVNPRVRIGDKIKLVFEKEFKYVSEDREGYEVITSFGFEEDDRWESDYFDESILYYINAGIITCKQITVNSLDPFSIKLVCVNNVDNFKEVIKEIEKAIKSTYIQTLLVYKNIYKPELTENDGYITFKNLYAADVAKSNYSVDEIQQILGENVEDIKTKRSLAFYHYSSRMKYYHGHMGVLHYEIPFEKAEEIFSLTYLFDQTINSTNFADFLSDISYKKEYVKKLNTVTAVTTISVKRLKNGTLSYNFDTIFYDNDNSTFINSEKLI
jgi:hypothetical protein